jgi:hypothetical protein
MSVLLTETVPYYRPITFIPNQGLFFSKGTLHAVHSPLSYQTETPVALKLHSKFSRIQRPVRSVYTKRHFQKITGEMNNLSTRRHPMTPLTVSAGNKKK